MTDDNKVRSAVFKLNEYLSKSEAWNTAELAEKIASEHGTSWTDYTVFFLLERTIQGYDLEELIIETTQLLHPAIVKIRLYAKYKILIFIKDILLYK